MKVVIQRVRKASVSVEGSIIASIEKGLLLLVGLGELDCASNFPQIINKIIELRIFPNLEKNSGFDLSIKDICGELLIVSQFTLYGDCRKGRRPSFSKALSPDKAKILYDEFCNSFRLAYSSGKIAEGKFAADMQVSLENDGPVTLIIDSQN